MSEEELEKTGILKDLLSKEDEEEMTINEMIEEFLEQLDYLDMDSKKKTKLKKGSARFLFLCPRAPVFSRLFFFFTWF